MAHRQSFLRTKVDAGSSSDSTTTPNYFPEKLDVSSPATSFGLPEGSPLHYTLAEVNKGVDTDDELIVEDPETQTSNSSAAIERWTQEAYQSLGSSQEESHTSPQSQPQEVHPLPMELDEPFESTASSQSQSSLLFSNGSSVPSQHSQREELVENYVDPMADSTLPRQKRALHDIAEGETDELQFSRKRPRRHQDISEYDADDDADGADYYEDAQNDNNGDSQCPKCLKKFSAESALLRHRRSITPMLLKCLDLSAGPLDVFKCSNCKESSARLDVMRKHVRRVHGHTYKIVAETYTVEQLRKMMTVETQVRKY